MAYTPGLFTSISRNSANAARDYQNWLSTVDALSERTRARDEAARLAQYNQTAAGLSQGAAPQDASYSVPTVPPAFDSGFGQVDTRTEGEPTSVGKGDMLAPGPQAGLAISDNVQIQPAADVTVVPAAYEQAPLNLSQRSFLASVDPTLRSAAAEQRLPQGFLTTLLGLESSYGTNLGARKNVMQFDKVTAAEVGYTLAELQADPNKAIDAAAKLAAKNRTYLTKALGREPEAWELYLAHQQGKGGSRVLLRNPNMNVVEALTIAYNGNKNKARQAVTQNGGNVNMTAGEFAGLWRNKYAASDALIQMPDAASVQPASSPVMQTAEYGNVQVTPAADVTVAPVQRDLEAQIQTVMIEGDLTREQALDLIAREPNAGLASQEYQQRAPTAASVQVGLSPLIPESNTAPRAEPFSLPRLPQTVAGGQAVMTPEAIAAQQEAMQRDREGVGVVGGSYTPEQGANYAPVDTTETPPTAEEAAAPTKIQDRAEAYGGEPTAGVRERYGEKTTPGAFYLDQLTADRQAVVSNFEKLQQRVQRDREVNLRIRAQQVQLLERAKQLNLPDVAQKHYDNILAVDAMLRKNNDYLETEYTKTMAEVRLKDAAVVGEQVRMAASEMNRGKPGRFAALVTKFIGADVTITEIPGTGKYEVREDGRLITPEGGASAKAVVDIYRPDMDQQSRDTYAKAAENMVKFNQDMALKELELTGKITEKKLELQKWVKGDEKKDANDQVISSTWIRINPDNTTSVLEMRRTPYTEGPGGVMIGGELKPVVLSVGGIQVNAQ